MPSKLRMKHTEEDIEKILRKERRDRKRRRKEEARQRPPGREESMTPPRAGPSAAGKLFSQEELDFDESALPPDQAYKQGRGVEEDQVRLEDSMAWAAQEDQGVGYYEELLYAREKAPSASFVYGSSAGVAMGQYGPKTGLNAMDDEEYAEHIRAQMWYRNNKVEAERREAVEKAKKEKLEKEEKEKEKRLREERRRIRKLEEVTSKRTEGERRDARASYEERWRKLLAPSMTVPPTPAATPPSATTTPTTEDPATSNNTLPLRFTDLPWPLYPPVPFPPLSWPSPSDITSSALTQFLLSHVDEADATKKKATLRSAVLAYHPDRFDRIVSRLPMELRERVKELDLRVSQELNELLKKA